MASETGGNASGGFLDFSFRDPFESAVNLASVVVADAGGNLPKSGQSIRDFNTKAQIEPKTPLKTTGNAALDQLRDLILTADKQSPKTEGIDAVNLTRDFPSTMGAFLSATKGSLPAQIGQDSNYVKILVANLPDRDIRDSITIMLRDAGVTTPQALTNDGVFKGEEIVRIFAESGNKLKSQSSEMTIPKEVVNSSRKFAESLGVKNPDQDTLMGLSAVAVSIAKNDTPEWKSKIAPTMLGLH